MHNITPQFKEYLKSSVLTLCTLWKVTRTDGRVFGFTDYRKDITIENTVFEANTGYRPSAIKTSSSLGVDNLEVEAPIYRSSSINDSLSSFAMTEEDIEAGLWDYARVDIWKCNYEDLSMGVLKMKSGHLGKITIKRNTYTAELRGITQALQQQIGRVYTPACAANFCDKNCRLKIEDWTFAGYVTRKIDQRSWIDEGLTQTNSENVITITGMSKTNPMVVTAPGHNMATSEQVTFSEIIGMTRMNGVTVPITYLNANQFQIAVDATTFPEYISGGKATKREVSEYFKDGVLTWISGNNKGLKCGVKSYNPSHVTLYDSMVFEIQDGDAYKITAGCDKLPSTCHGRFNNIENFYGFNLVPGNNRIMSGG